MEEEEDEERVGGMGRWREAEKNYLFANINLYSGHIGLCFYSSSLIVSLNPSCIYLTRHDPRSHSGCYWGFPLTDVGQEGEEQAVPGHGKDDTG